MMMIYPNTMRQRQETRRQTIRVVFVSVRAENILPFVFEFGHTAERNGQHMYNLCFIGTDGTATYKQTLDTKRKLRKASASNSSKQSQTIAHNV